MQKTQATIPIANPAPPMPDTIIQKKSPFDVVGGGAGVVVVVVCSFLIRSTPIL